MKRKVLLIGWDSADWKMIDQLMDAGLMPAMKRVVDNGVRARFATLDPPLSPMLWTTMATGKRPFKHGILGFVESDGSGGLRPISSYGRKVNAFWNMFTKEGLKTNVVGWWPSNPVESINGVMVSNLFQQEKKKGKHLDMSEWTVEPGMVYPEEYADQLGELRIHLSEIFGAMVQPFVPKAKELDEKKDMRLNLISKFLAHSGTLHAVCTELMETTEWDVMAVYHDALDHFSHTFMRYNPPKMNKVSDEDFHYFKDVVKGAYIYHDMMLERLLNMIDENTTVVICSDHGFHSDHLRPEVIPKTPAGPAAEHSPYGIFAAMGPGIKKGETIYGAKVLDLTPTLLTLFDLPVGKDMDGKPLLDMYEDPKEVKYIDSWENDTRYGGELVIKDTGSSSADTESALQQLIDLGYIDDINEGEGEADAADAEGPEDAKEKMKQRLRDTLRESSYYLAKSYISAGLYEEALEVLLEIENREKPEQRYLIEIIKAATKTKRYALAEEYIKFVKTKKLLSPQYIDTLEANVLVGLNRAGEALSLLEKSFKVFPDSQEIAMDYGRLLNMLNQSVRAKEIYAHILKEDPQNHLAYQGYGLAALRNEEYELALEYLLKSIDLIYHNPKAHLLLGETLVMMREYEMAISSFEVVEALAPNLPKSYLWLYDLHTILGNEESAKKYKSIVDGLSKGEKIILTGLPSEKLAQVMKNLREMGYNISGEEADFNRKDINVLEKGWMEELKGDVIYMPTHLIPSLPPRFFYRILYVNENVETATAYLNKMNKIRQNTYNQEFLDGLKLQDRNVKVWIDQQPLLDVYYIDQLENLDDVLLKQFIAI